MLLRFLGLLLLLISTASFAEGRGPAVEDFVGIEIDQPEITPQGTEALYNLEQDLSKMEKKERPELKKISSGFPESKNWNMTVVFGVSVLLGLPLIVWFLVMGHLKKKASLESASNIEVLEKYRREREKKSADIGRKAS